MVALALFFKMTLYQTNTRLVNAFVFKIKKRLTKIFRVANFNSKDKLKKWYLKICSLEKNKNLKTKLTQRK